MKNENYDAHALSKYLGRDTGQLFDCVRSGTLPRPFIENNRMMWRASEIEDFRQRGLLPFSSLLLARN